MTEQIAVLELTFLADTKPHALTIYPGALSGKANSLRIQCRTSNAGQALINLQHIGRD
jgi:hypothetical protein